MAALGLCCHARAFSSCGEWRLLFSWGAWVSHCLASLFVEHVGSKLLAPGLYSKGTRVVVPGLGCSAACGIFLEIEVKVKVAQSLRL